MAATNPNGSYLQQADPQSFGSNPMGGAAPNYPNTAAQQQHNQQQAQQQQTQQSSSSHTDLPKDEVGWYFVEQYYTTLNKTPDRLHLFYNKRSSFVWGTEGESLPLAHGRTEIHDKIMAHNFKDCKVRVSNVDSQASSNNGVVIQVLGEMSNDGNLNRKFSQTFFLAEQPNGYYVLNDIFRYLKDDDDVDEEEAYDYDAAEASAEEVAEVVAEVAGEVAEEIATELAEAVEDLSVKETTKVDVQVEGDHVTVEETTTTEVVPEPEAPAEATPVNGDVEPTNGETPAQAEPEPKAEETPAPPAEPEVPAAEPAAPAPAAEEKPAPPAAPAKEPEKAPEKAAAPAAAPAPAPAPAPARPKTWANLVAASGPKTEAPAAQAAPAAPAAAAAAAPKPEASAPQATPSTPATPTTPGGGSQWQTADNKRHSRAAASSSTPGQTLAYVKNVSESVSNEALKNALAKFGPLNHFEIHRAKNCAFVEFATPAGFAAANAANPHVIAGSNVLVEERRPRVPPNGTYGNRGGMTGGRGDGRPMQGGRGGYQSRDGGRFEGGRGRGNTRGGFNPRGRAGTPTS